MADDPIQIDLIELECKGCKRVRTFDVELVGAQAIIEWLKANATRCGCGADRCDVACRYKGSSEASPFSS